MIEEFGKQLGISVRGFEWKGALTKIHYPHFVEFMGWDGEIYVKDVGILTYKQYYLRCIQRGLCVYANGMIIAKTGYSEHYNSLQKWMLQFEDEQNESTTSYPLKNKGDKGVFESAVSLFQLGILDQHQIKTRIERYIQPEQQASVFQSLTGIA